jgi:hypothetical protein
MRLRNSRRKRHQLTDILPFIEVDPIIERIAAKMTPAKPGWLDRLQSVLLARLAPPVVLGLWIWTSQIGSARALLRHTDIDAEVFAPRDQFSRLGSLIRPLPRAKSVMRRPSLSKG